MRTWHGHHNEFLKDVEREERAQREHRTRVRFDGSYRAVCSCRWNGPAREDRHAAERDAQEHRA